MVQHFIDVPQGLHNKLLKFLWGVNEKPLFITKTWYKLSTMRQSHYGIIMLTRGALYVFTKRLFRGPSLRLHINLLHCRDIRLDNGSVFLEFLPLRRKEKGQVEIEQEEEDEKYFHLSFPITELRPDEELLCTLPASHTPEPPILPPQPPSQDPNPVARPPQERPNTETVENDQEDKPKGRRDLDHVTLTIRSSASDVLFTLMLNVLKSNLWKVRDACSHVPRVRASVHFEPEVFNDRPKHSLKRRALFFAHYCFSSGSHSECAEYFQSKWNGEPLLVIGKSFHPGGYAAPFGCAIGMEAAITQVCFQSARFTYLSALLSALLKSAQMVSTIGFTDYERGTEIPIRIVDVKRTRVTTWTLLNCCAAMVRNVLNSFEALDDPPLRITIGRHSYNKEDAESIFTTIAGSENVRWTERLFLVSLNFNDFPRTAFVNMCCAFENIEMLQLSKFNTDGSTLFEAVISSNSRLRKLSLLSMKFEKPLSFRGKLPETLVMIDVSKSRFVGRTFADFLMSITAEEAEVPFFLVARKMRFNDDCFPTFREVMEYDKCKPNILELDMSMNHLEHVSFQPLFTFMRTQKRLRNVVFDHLTTDDQRNFVHYLSMAASTNRLAGVDLSGQFEPLIVQQFLASLAGARDLRRLSILNCPGGNKSYNILGQLLTLLTNLTEVVCDGMKPSRILRNENHSGKRHPLVRWWKKVASSKSIISNDLPIEDLAVLGFTLDRLPEDDQVWMAELQPPYRCKPTTFEKRLDFLMEQRMAEDPIGIEQALSKDVYFYLDSASIPEEYLQKLDRFRMAKLRETMSMTMTIDASKPMPSESSSSSSDEDT